MKFMRNGAQYTRQGYKTSEDIFSELKINPFVKKIQNYGNKRIQHVRRMDRDRQTDRLPHLIMKYKPCGKRSQGRPFKRLLDS
jgi:hypothetical protein